MPRPPALGARCSPACRATVIMSTQGARSAFHLRAQTRAKMCTKKGMTGRRKKRSRTCETVLDDSIGSVRMVERSKHGHLYRLWFGSCLLFQNQSSIF